MQKPSVSTDEVQRYIVYNDAHGVLWPGQGVRGGEGTGGVAAEENDEWSD